MKKSKAPAADGSLKKKEKSKAGKYSKVPPPKQQVEQPTKDEDEPEPMEGMSLIIYVFSFIWKIIHNDDLVILI